MAMGGTSTFCMYDAVQQTFTANGLFQPYGAAFSADGNVAASYLAFLDASANVVGRIAQPDIFVTGYSISHPLASSRSWDCSLTLAAAFTLCPTRISLTSWMCSMEP